MKLTFLGTGTSHGVPVIGCNCSVCKSKNKKDKRNRSSVYIITDDENHILIDVTPEFRIQALKFNISKIDDVLLTHSHADHLHGIDDLRVFSNVVFHHVERETPPIPVYSSKKTCLELKERFPYLFITPKEGGGHAKIELRPVCNQFNIGETLVTPIPMMHGRMETTGWLLTKAMADGTKTSIAYLTDCNYISDDSFSLIKNNCGTLKHLIIDGLRIKEHSTHFNFLQAMQAAQTIGCAQNVWITHMTHNTSHRETQKYIDENLKKYPGLKKACVKPAYDGLVLEI